MDKRPETSFLSFSYPALRIRQSMVMVIYPVRDCCKFDKPIKWMARGPNRKFKRHGTTNEKLVQTKHRQQRKLISFSSTQRVSSIYTFIPIVFSLAVAIVLESFLSKSLAVHKNYTPFSLLTCCFVFLFCYPSFECLPTGN